MKKKYFTILLYHFITLSLFSQEIKNLPAVQAGGEVYAYARKIVDTMASESMHGRGYVNGGDSIAANYLKNEFSRIGLKSFGNDYYQKMSFAINTFPDKIQFRFGSGADAVEFVGLPGKNFLIDPSCPSIYTDIGVGVFDSTDCSEKAYKKFCKKLSHYDFVLIDDRNVTNKEKRAYFDKIRIPNKKIKGTIELKKKLTWSQSQYVSNQVKIDILLDSFKLNLGYYDGGGIEIKNKFIPNHSSQNVIGYIPGSVYPDSFIVYSAHYDHLGYMGSAMFPGANDNASGCAMLLNLANYYSKPENKPKYSIAFMAFCGEEVGLLGSKYYTENPLFPLKNIKFVFNMDIMGTGEDGITVVNGTIFKTEFDKLKEINTQHNFIKDVKIRGKTANSDHYFFSEKGVKAFFIYSMGGIKAYHDIYDRAETLPLNEFENMFKLITKFGESLQQ